MAVASNGNAGRFKVPRLKVDAVEKQELVSSIGELVAAAREQAAVLAQLPFEGDRASIIGLLESLSLDALVMSRALDGALGLFSRDELEFIRVTVEELKADLRSGSRLLQKQEVAKYAEVVNSVSMNARALFADVEPRASNSAMRMMGNARASDLLDLIGSAKREALQEIREESGAISRTAQKEIGSIVAKATENMAIIQGRLQATESAVASHWGEMRTRVDETLENLDRDSEALMSGIRGRFDEATRILEVIAVSATGGEFLKEAAGQSSQADRWRKAAVALGALAAATLLAGYVVGLLTRQDFSLSILLQHLSLSGIMLGLASYAAKQSGDHRRREEEAKRLALDLAAFSPFIQRLPESEQNQASLEFVQRIFGRVPSGRDSSADAVVGNGDMTIVSRLLEEISKGKSPN